MGVMDEADNTYSRFPQIRNYFFRYSLLFSNNSFLFYSLFNMKIEICCLYKGVSYSRELAVLNPKHLVVLSADLISQSSINGKHCILDLSLTVDCQMCHFDSVVSLGVQ